MEIGFESEISDEARRILEDWDREAAALDTFINALAGATLDLRVQLAPILATDQHAVSEQGWLAAQSEFLCFLLHLVSRISLAELGFAKRDLLHEKLAAPSVEFLLSKTVPYADVVEIERLRRNIMDSIREAELRYGKCSKTINLTALQQSYLDMTLDEQQASADNHEYWAEIGLISPTVMSAMDPTYLFGQLGTRIMTSVGKPQDAKGFVDLTLACHEISRKLDLSRLVQDLGSTL